VRSDGAIATNPDGWLVRPYFANFAAIGLAQAAAEGNAAAAEAAWRWLEWYRDHRAATGVVNDHETRAGALTDTGDVDATDATAATFLVAVDRVAAASPDPVRLAALEGAIRGSVDAIAAVQDVDGLTWAKPTYPVKYLMDNVEVYAGLLAAARVADRSARPDLAADARRRAELVSGGLRSLWNPATGAYDWALHPSGGRDPVRPSVFYPDAVAQLWMVASGLVEPPTARRIADRFVAEHPAWFRPTAVERFPTGSGPVGYWPMIAHGLAVAGVDPSAELERLQLDAVASGAAWPFTSAVAGQMMAPNPLAAVGGQAGSG